MKYEDLPFSRGATWFNGETIPSSLATGDSPGGFNLEGKEYIHEDVTYGTGMYVKVRAIRNASTKNILPGQLVDVSAVTDFYSRTVLPGTNGSHPTVVESTYSFPADEFLPPGGVPPGDLFWVVVSGPALLKTTASGVPTLALLQKVVSCTANGTTSTDAGGVIGVEQDGTFDTALNLSIQNSVGRAMSVITSSQTATAVLVGVGW